MIFRPGPAGMAAEPSLAGERPTIDKFRIEARRSSLPGRKSGFRAGFRPDSSRGNINIGSFAGPRTAGGPMLMLARLESG